MFGEWTFYSIATVGPSMVPMSRIVVGIDLAGPANAAGTVLVAGVANGTELRIERVVDGASDSAIFDTCRELATGHELFVGLDAPLSYQPGGGDRPGDADLRRHLVTLGLKPGTVMPPTLHRMVYLTLRGIHVARMLLPLGAKIAEVHPAGSLAYAGANVDDVKALKSDSTARFRLLAWLESSGLHGAVESFPEPSDHAVAACAALFAAWIWSDGRCGWHWPAEPPHHPHDYIC